VGGKGCAEAERISRGKNLMGETQKRPPLKTKKKGNLYELPKNQKQEKTRDARSISKEKFKTQRGREADLKVIGGGKNRRGGKKACRQREAWNA